MPKRSSKKNIRDVNVLAAHILEQATGESKPKPEDASKNRDYQTISLILSIFT